MRNLLRNTTELAQALCREYIDEFRKEGGELTAVDATCGNGHDTLWLAKLCDRVYAFDIQSEAIEATAQLLGESNISFCRRAADEGEAGSEKQVSQVSVELICDSHENMKKYVSKQAAVIVFNLGYLPGADKTVTTTADSTIEALEKALDLLRINGLLCVSVYWGHNEGKAERTAVLEWAEELDSRAYHCVHTDMLNQPNCPPEILLVTKKKATA